MIAVNVQVPYASFRKSFARSYAETYPLPPPATVYGMLLSLVGERLRCTHAGVRLAFAYRRRPQVATTLRKLSRFKYGVPGKQSKLGNAPDFIETLCGLDFICWIDSSDEKSNKPLESRVKEAIESPDRVNRYGVLSLGLSDDAVDDVRLCSVIDGKWLRLIPTKVGSMELPVWVDHVGAEKTRWDRYDLDDEPIDVRIGPTGVWDWTTMSAS